MKLEWTVREPPLSPRAVVALGEHARSLARRVLESDDEALGALSGVSADDAIVIVGAGERLPWVDGAMYLGVDPEAPGLFLPTTLHPGVPAWLLARALGARFPDAPPGPLAVLPSTGGVVPLGPARPLDRARLARLV